MTRLAPQPLTTPPIPQLIIWSAAAADEAAPPPWHPHEGAAIIHLTGVHAELPPPAAVLHDAAAHQAIKLTHQRQQPLVHPAQIAKVPAVAPLLCTEIEGKLHIVLSINSMDSPHIITSIQGRIGQILRRLKAYAPNQTFINCVDLWKHQSPADDGCPSHQDIAHRIVQKLIHGYSLATYPLPQYKSSTGPVAAIHGNLVIIAAAQTFTPAQLTTAHHLANASNHIRHLMVEPANILTPRAFVTLVQKDSRNTKKLSSTFYSYDRLRRMGAHAFCAVARAHPHSGAGILKLTYKPTKLQHGSYKSIALVGKGVTYDVGGVNVKPARYMKGMHHDMTGAAMAYSLIKLAATSGWPYHVTAYLAISDNLISASAFKPDDLITSLSGQTIEVVHTDAEGRMMLADTLTLASATGPDLIMDFATLTGASTAAISDQYHSLYTNRPAWHPYLLKAAELAGEKVWPFPLDDDLAACLDSKVADTKQCRTSGGVDHIEAALFLKKFISHNIPWIHLDLSHASTEKVTGLHLSEETGAGTTFVHELIAMLPNIQKSSG